MAAFPEPSVGLRELRQHARELIDRVQHGESIEITQSGRPVARIVPIEQPTLPPVLARLVATGRARPATRPGYRPSERPGDGSNRLSNALAELRDEESW